MINWLSCTASSNDCLQSEGELAGSRVDCTVVVEFGFAAVLGSRNFTVCNKVVPYCDCVALSTVAICQARVCCSFEQTNARCQRCPCTLAVNMLNGMDHKLQTCQLGGLHELGLRE